VPPSRAAAAGASGMWRGAWKSQAPTSGRRLPPWGVVQAAARGRVTLRKAWGERWDGPAVNGPGSASGPAWARGKRTGWVQSSAVEWLRPLLAGAQGGVWREGAGRSARWVGACGPCVPPAQAWSHTPRGGGARRR